MKILLNYKYEYDPQTTGHYVERALKRMGHTVIKEREQITCDLVLQVEPYDHHHIDGTPNFVWEFDTCLRGGGFFSDNINNKEYKPDRIFTVCKCHETILPTQYLPVAADPYLHRPFEYEKEFDIAFVGRADASLYPERVRLLDELQKKFNVLRTTSEHGLGFSRTLSKGKLIFNRTISTCANLRVFEGMAIGPVVTNYLPIMDDLAEPMVHYIPYSSDEELFENVERLLRDDKLREQIAQNARELVIEKHTYDHRLKEILKYV